jgi:hypothetical protein
LKQQLGLVANDARPARQLGPGASEDAEAAVVMERKQRG